MPAEKEIRKLAAIMHADVKGYSRLMGEDESYTVRCLGECRQLFDESIRAHGGRVVNAPGDSILAEFPSVVSAVQCAVEIQDRLKERNIDLPASRKMEYRIGVNLGDVIESEDVIYGDGVNIAARIEALAEPGGVSISRTVFDHSHKKLKYGYEYQGEHLVKNISDPVQVYKLLTAPEDAGKVIFTAKRKSFIYGGHYLALTTLMFLLATIALLLFLPTSSQIEPASVEKMSFPLPEKPSIAVLPLENLSPDPNQEYFCDGLTMDIISSLSKVPDLFVIARDTIFTFKGKPINIKQVAEELGVRYVLHGTVRKAGDRIRINFLLADALKGNHLWTERYDRDLKETFALQDEITMKILTSLQVELTEGEKIRVLTKGTTNLSAYEKWLKGRDHFLRFNIKENLIGRQLLEEAIGLDPEFTSAYVDLAWTHIMEIYLGSSKSPKESLEKATELAKKAVMLDETSPFAQSLLGVILTMKRQYKEAIEQGKRAVSLSPNYSLAQAQLGRTLMYFGQYEEALSWFKNAIRLDPIPKNWFITAKGICLLHLGKYEEAVQEFKTVYTRNPKDFTNLTRLAMGYSLLNEKEQAIATAREILKLNPNFSVAGYAKSLPYKSQKDRQFVMDALIKTGLPE